MSRPKTVVTLLSWACIARRFTSFVPAPVPKAPAPVNDVDEVLDGLGGGLALGPKLLSGEEVATRRQPF